jgi:hypothetical protein
MTWEKVWAARALELSRGPPSRSQPDGHLRYGQAIDRAAYLYLACLPPPRHAGRLSSSASSTISPTRKRRSNRAIEEFKVPANQRDRLRPFRTDRTDRTLQLGQ